MNKLAVIGGSANPALTTAICTNLGIEQGAVRLRRFADGEMYPQIFDNVRGTDLFIVQPTCKPVNDNLMELLLMIDAGRRASAKRITAVLPYYGYARQDRKDKPRVPISAKLVAGLLEHVKVKRILTLDLHSQPIGGFFECPVDHLFAQPVFLDHVKELKLPNLTVVSPDAGGVERARNFASRINAPLAIIDKRRTDMNVAEVMNIIGDVKGRHCMMIDDIIDTAGTLVKGAVALMQAGAESVRAAATHGLFSTDANGLSAYEKIKESPLVEVFVTDSVPTQPTNFIHVISVAPLLAKAIKSVHEQTSVSTLFV